MSPLANDVRFSIAGKTGQYASQYRHALHTVITCWPRASAAAFASPRRDSPEPWRRPSGASMSSGLRPRDPAEHRADRHADARHVTLPEDVAGHDLAGGHDVLRRLSVLHQHARPVVDFESQIG